MTIQSQHPVQSEALRRLNRRKTLNRVCLYLFLTIVAFVMAFPFLWMVSSALKTKDEVMNSFSLIPRGWLWGNFVEAYNGAPFGTYILNSLITALCIVAIQIVNSAMIAYALTQLRFKGRGVLFAVIMGTNMLPAAATYVPSSIILARLFRWKFSSPTARISSTIRISGSTTVAMEKARRMIMPEE